eukprot:GDKI01037624.1.p1 GENE.GDKI01037624.1~~GDKI01037624.1.p1  ORF type:complete len:485 (-),score=78.18 GDKI01037624.1:365-1819(-)
MHFLCLPFVFSLFYLAHTAHSGLESHVYNLHKGHHLPNVHPNRDTPAATVSQIQTNNIPSVSDDFPSLQGPGVVYLPNTTSNLPKAIDLLDPNSYQLEVFFCAQPENIWSRILVESAKSVGVTASNICSGTESDFVFANKMSRQYSRFKKQIDETADDQPISPPKGYDRLRLRTSDIDPDTGKIVIYMHVDGWDIVFNGVYVTEIINRYIRIGPNGNGKWLVASAERSCWLGRYCTPEEEALVPDPPVIAVSDGDGHFLVGEKSQDLGLQWDGLVKYPNSGGYMGPKSALVRMYAWVERQRTHTSEHVRKLFPVSSDQAALFRYVFRHTQESVLDYNQTIFGSFLEVFPKACEGGGGLQTCAHSPCCTVPEPPMGPQVVLSRYAWQGCVTLRENHQPVLWHGNGSGRTMYQVSLAMLRDIRQCEWMGGMERELLMSTGFATITHLVAFLLGRIDEQTFAHLRDSAHAQALRQLELNAQAKLLQQ